MKKLNQTGFSAIEGLLVLVIVTIVGGAGYYVYHASQKSNDTLKAPSSATQTKVSKAESVIAVDKQKLPASWAAVVVTPSTISLADTANKCTALVSQTASPSLDASGAQAFVNRKIDALGKAGTSDSKVTVGTAVDQTVGGQTVAMYPVSAKDSKGQATNYEKVGYVVGKGYYVYIVENCADQAKLPKVDSALSAVTIKS